ncbi:MULTISPECIES: hypothetical protein [unclassified Novosphingobium]|uniref:hypothetical protein n=1 Tax=unclassified Novosphingobium TaxID=2644732 RepID=UPI0025DBE44E|nr:MULTISPECIES: hypothetical protein [unclassified Novosphingobium]HQV01861.1 hypothetical protein [Novosphingobium sp.]
MNLQDLFKQLLNAGTEDEVQAILDARELTLDATKWHPYGDNESNYGVVENQQAHAVPALVEKITNGIDAILEKKVVQDGIDIRSKAAPQSVPEALDRYFPGHRNWDLGEMRRQQARDVQIVASGPRNDTSLLIYDDGIGQAPEDFSTTFLSLLRGNKNEVHFVQGKYNMGGAGAIAFCGDKRFQLVASKRFDGKHPLGFTLVRRHPPKLAAAAGRKNTWYEYLVFDGKVPSIEIDDLVVGLDERKFRTGSLIKLYSYRLPSGARSIISRDLNVSLNEYLFEPALPFLTVDNNVRYPDNKAPIQPVYGLRRRLEADTETIEAKFSVQSNTTEFGELTATVYVFKARSRGQGVKDTQRYLEREYFRNNMTVLFSMNGQVQGSYTSEFVSRALNMPLLKKYLLVHVDCSRLHPEVRNELFMASRDRLKAGDEADAIRKHLREILLGSDLKEISRRRKANLNLDSDDTGKMLRDLTRNLPMNEALSRILRQTFDLPSATQSGNAKRGASKRDANARDPREIPPFHPQRYPSSFHVKGGDSQEEGMKLFQLPKGGSRSISFATDVENEYFDRTDDPGELRLAILAPADKAAGGEGRPEPTEEAELLDIMRASPADGTIKVGVRASSELNVGATVRLRATLSSPQGDLTETVLVRITDPDRKPKVQRPEVSPPLGLPEPIFCSEAGGPGIKSWEDINAGGIDMDHGTIVYPFVDEDKLAGIYINLDSSVLKDFKTKATSPEGVELAERRYISAVYFHTLFLFATTRSRHYELARIEGDEREDVDLADYVSDLFKSSYAQFLLNFDTADLMDALG